MGSNRFRILVCLGAISIAGCATISGLRTSKEDGVATEYNISVDRAWKITEAIFDSKSIKSEEKNREKGYWLGTMSMSMSHYGTLIGVWIEGVEPGKTRVTVLTRRRLATTIETEMTEEEFHRTFRSLASLAGK